VPGPARPSLTAGHTARASVEVWALTVVAHTIAGGALPDIPWLVGLAGLVAGATAVVLRNQARPWLLAPVLVASQLGLHALFASLASSGHASHHTHQAIDLSPRMLAAHGVCAVLTAVVWWVRRWVVEVVLQLAASVPVAARPSAPPAPSVGWAASTKVWLVGDPGRAPPLAV
jgi:hypothetical protein